MTKESREITARIKANRKESKFIKATVLVCSLIALGMIAVSIYAIVNYIL